MEIAPILGQKRSSSQERKRGCGKKITVPKISEPTLPAEFDRSPLSINADAGEIMFANHSVSNIVVV